MPTIGISRSVFFKKMGSAFRKYSRYWSEWKSMQTFVFFSADEGVHNLLFEYGLELDEIVCFINFLLEAWINWDFIQIEEEETSETNEDKNLKPSSNTERQFTYKIDIPANRYDLLCVEGVTTALLIYVGR